MTERGPTATDSKDLRRAEMSQSAPSPLVGEGARRADEGRGPDSRLKGFARNLRRRATPHERLLWGQLRSRRFAEFKFRRQVPIGPFIADFVCYEAKLVVELDGAQHADDPSDVRRDAEFDRRGFRVLRVWNNELTNNEAGVLDAIWYALSEGTAIGREPPHPPFGHLLPQGEKAMEPTHRGTDGRHK
jgi:very-short-patch-repair endonuclease